MKRNKGSRVEAAWERGIYLDFAGFKVSGIMILLRYSTGYESRHRIPPHLLISEAERSQSIGTQLTLPI